MSKNMLKAIWFQITKTKTPFKNIFITHNAFGIFHINSHVVASTGKDKVMYPTVESAQKAADAMEKKRNVHFSVYKCGFCDGYHIGRNRENK